MRAHPRILVADDDLDFRGMVCRALFLYGYEPVPVAQTAAAIEAATDGAVDAVLTDLTRPDARSLRLVRVLHDAAGSPPILAVTGLAVAPEVRALGVAVLGKPFTPTQLDDALRALLQTRGETR
jgi:DNA-binding response OmpR family regulator